MQLALANSYTGSTSITAGTLAIAGSGSLGSGTYAAAIANSGALVVNTTTNQIFSGAITGGGSLTQIGRKHVDACQPATNYTGPTTVSGGRLIISNDTGFASPMTINAGGRLSWTGTTNVERSAAAQRLL